MSGLVWLDCTYCRNIAGPYDRDVIDALIIDRVACRDCVQWIGGDIHGMGFFDGSFIVASKKESST